MEEALSEERIRSWREGIAHFNERRFWEAHEAWERGWLLLSPERKLYIQALIQGASVFHLIGLGRAHAARRLAARALEKLTQPPPPFPRIEVPGLESRLLQITSLPAEASLAELSALASAAPLEAELLLSPPA